MHCNATPRVPRTSMYQLPSVSPGWMRAKSLQGVCVCVGGGRARQGRAAGMRTHTRAYISMYAFPRVLPSPL